ncbi:hypothetical protein CDAR_93761 [Caerostris darwini]|uniref:Uncharacterized protein n=1 Tax=Caerostris darwini TaxID=1538125 RepID=A0AAV4NK36_9ARAC|nr:hypothetical protein CDAR_93761 [Caerostris darwini]
MGFYTPRIRYDLISNAGHTLVTWYGTSFFKKNNYQQVHCLIRSSSYQIQKDGGGRDRKRDIFRFIPRYIRPKNTIFHLGGDTVAEIQKRYNLPPLLLVGPGIRRALSRKHCSR